MAKDGRGEGVKVELSIFKYGFHCFVWRMFSSSFTIVCISSLWDLEPGVIGLLV